MLKKGRQHDRHEESASSKADGWCYITKSHSKPRAMAWWTHDRGLVWSPGSRVLVACSNRPGQFEQRHHSSVFGSIDDAKEAFGVQGVYVVRQRISYLFCSKEPGPQRPVKENAWTAFLGLTPGDVRQLRRASRPALGTFLCLYGSARFALAAMGVSSS